MAGVMPRRLTPKIRDLPMKRLQARSTAPSAHYNSKRKSAPDAATTQASIRIAEPSASLNAGKSSIRPASANTRLAIWPATRQHAHRWATWPKASNAIRSLNLSSAIKRRRSVSGSTRAAASVRNSLSPTASNLEGAAVSGSDPSYLQPTLRQGRMMGLWVLRAPYCLAHLVSKVARANQQEAGQSCANQIVSSV